jgi:putative Mn2+ efflux pump MntP
LDAFSVATTAGLSLEKVDYGMSFKIAFTFGIFHIFMPLMGWYIGSEVIDFISGYDHWVAFILLAFIGVKMVYEAIKKKQPIEADQIIGVYNLLLISIAVSIDSLAVGLSFFLERIPILVPSIIIGSVTTLAVFIGTVIGGFTSKSLGKNSQMIGGIILILIGIRILTTHIL